MKTSSQEQNFPTQFPEGQTFKTPAYGASGGLIGGKSMKRIDVERQGPKADEVVIEVLYCGVCHSDIHQVANDWKNTIYPCVPGHEIIGKIVAAGSTVSAFKTGDTVGVGCMIDSCHTCAPCREGEEQFCEGPHGMTMTYNGYWKPDGTDFNTFGGYSTHIVVNKDFLLRIPENLDLAKVAPILCAGITTYSPLNHWKVQEGDKVAIVGIGGLGHMGVMLAKAMGAHVTAVTRKEEKKQAALELGADAVLISDDADAMNAHEAKFDYVLITIPESFDVNDYVKLVKRRGSLVTVGLIGPYEKPTDNMEVAKLCRTVGGSLIGGIAETQEVLDFCAKHDILPQVEMIQMQDIEKAFDTIKDEEIRFRYVIDMASLKQEEAG
ncbi:MAG: NAD(P)-dependent alcohol dehydrogenase [Sphingobacteriales bacterium]|nr:MAG: NAD(P)-dependent alcohol dehydrogenase [Sphingobacteriales bacterium]